MKSAAWFIWNGKTSIGMGLIVNDIPPIVRPKERTSQVTIPGRAGDLTLLEGDDIYEPYTKKITVTCRNEFITEEMLGWLRGEGELILCTEPFVYEARIAAEVSFSRIGRAVSQAVIPFWCQPYKKAQNPERHIFTATDGMVIRNLGNVASKPKITITGTGALSILISDGSGDTGNQMTFTHLPGDLVIDCDAGIMKTTAKSYDGNAYYYAGDYCTYQGGAAGTYEYGLYRFTTEGIGSSTEWEYVSSYVGTEYSYWWPGAWSGDYLRIPGGKSEIVINGSAGITIDPRWRWI